MTLDELRSQHREQILQIANRYGATGVQVFGSTARGDADIDSDVDFLVELEPGRSLLDIGGMLMDLRDELSCRVDVVTKAGLRNRIRERVLKEAVVL